MMSGKTLNSVDTIDAEIQDNYDEPLQPYLYYPQMQHDSTIGLVFEKHF
jgi:hypothetical protein